MEESSYIEIESSEVESSEVESTEVEASEGVSVSPDFSLGGIGLTNIILIGVLVFLILIFARSRNG